MGTWGLKMSYSSVKIVNKITSGMSVFLDHENTGIGILLDLVGVIVCVLCTYGYKWLKSEIIWLQYDLQMYFNRARVPKYDSKLQIYMSSMTKKT